MKIECMYGLDCCLCVWLCMCMWLGGSVYLFAGGAVYIASQGQGTFTNCNFTSNSASIVSLEEEHVDDCEMSECMTLRLCPPCISS